MNKELLKRLTEIQNYSAIPVKELWACYLMIAKVLSDSVSPPDVVDELAFDAVVRAADLSALYNDAFLGVADDLYFICRGTSVWMRVGRVVISINKILKALGGVSFFEATDQELSRARLQIIMDETDRFVGAARKLGDTYNGRVKLLRFHLRELWQEIKRAIAELCRK